MPKKKQKKRIPQKPVLHWIVRERYKHATGERIPDWIESIVAEKSAEAKGLPDWEARIDLVKSALEAERQVREERLEAARKRLSEIPETLPSSHEVDELRSRAIYYEHETEKLDGLKVLIEQMEREEASARKRLEAAEAEYDEGFSIFNKHMNRMKAPKREPLESRGELDLRLQSLQEGLEAIEGALKERKIHEMMIKQGEGTAREIEKEAENLKTTPEARLFAKTEWVIDCVTKSMGEEAGTWLSDLVEMSDRWRERARKDEDSAKESAASIRQSTAYAKKALDGAESEESLSARVDEIQAQVKTCFDELVALNLRNDERQQAHKLAMQAWEDHQKAASALKESYKQAMKRRDEARREYQMKLQEADKARGMVPEGTTLKELLEKARDGWRKLPRELEDTEALYALRPEREDLLKDIPNLEADVKALSDASHTLLGAIDEVIEMAGRPV